MKINEKAILSTNVANKFREQYGATDEQILCTEVFRYFQYGILDNNFDLEPLSLIHTDNIDFDKDPWRLVDLNDNYLRANDDRSIFVMELDDLVEYLLYRYYTPTSKNDYDLQFLFDTLDKKAFVKRLEKNRMGSFIEINGKYYVSDSDGYFFDKQFIDQDDNIVYVINDKVY